MTDIRLSTPSLALLVDLTKGFAGRVRNVQGVGDAPSFSNDQCPPPPRSGSRTSPRSPLTSGSDRKRTRTSPLGEGRTMQTGRGRGHRGSPPALARYLGQRPHAVQLEQTPERAPEETGPRRPRPWRFRRDSNRTRGEGRLDAETRFGRWTLSAREGKASAGQPVVGRLLPRAHQQREMLQPLAGRPDTKSRPDWCGKAPLQKWRGARPRTLAARLSDK